MSKTVREQLPHGSNRNKIEALADIIDNMPKSESFAPVSLALKPQRFESYRGSRKDLFLLVDEGRPHNGYYEQTKSHRAINLRQFAKKYEVPAGQYPDQVIHYQFSSGFELLIKGLDEAYADLEKLKGLKLKIFLNTQSQVDDHESTVVAYIPATLIKNKYDGILISGERHGTFSLQVPVAGDITSDKYLACTLDWSDTDLEFSSYSKNIMWKENAYDIVRPVAISNSFGVRLSILDARVIDKGPIIINDDPEA